MNKNNINFRMEFLYLNIEDKLSRFFFVIFFWDFYDFWLFIVLI